jgi:hypothetical protein
MRFIAIIGLCLMAVFSLVNDAAQEQRDAQTEVVEQSRDEVPAAPAVVGRAAPLQAPPVAVQQHRHEQTADSSPQTPRQPPLPKTAAERPAEEAAVEQGFTLEFESVDALETLLAAGNIELFVRGDNHYWSYSSSSGWTPADAPTGYYPMHAETVPARLRALATGTLGMAPGAWGVTLPTSTSRTVRQLMADRTGGALLIGTDGAVRLEGEAPRRPY